MAPPPQPPPHHPPPPPSQSLRKQKSWSPDSYREEIWLRKKEQSYTKRRTKSLTDEDMDELKACIELGFRFDSPEVESDTRLSDTLPALEFYCAVNRSYNNHNTLLKSSKLSSSSSLSSLGTPSSSESDLSISSPVDSPLTMFSPGDDPNAIKTKLRHWAQVVACSVKQSW